MNAPELMIFGANGGAETDATAQGRPTSSGEGTSFSAPKRLLILQPQPAVFILQLAQPHLTADVIPSSMY